MKGNVSRSITMQQLEALIHLVEERSFSRAARRMHLTQPSLTKHMKNLEMVINAELVDRTTRELSLTAEGKVLYATAKKIFKILDEAEEKIAHEKNGEEGIIYISASSIPATYILPRLLTRFSGQYNNIQCRIQVNDTESTVNMICDDNAEIGFIGKQVSQSKLTVEPLWDDRLILVVPQSHPFARREMVTWHEVQREPFIMRERGSATRSIFEEHLKKKGYHTEDLTIVCEVGSSAAVKEAVMAGLGVSYISMHAVKNEIAAGNLRDVPVNGDTVLERKIYLIYKKHRLLKRHHHLFLDYIRHHTDIHSDR